MYNVTYRACENSSLIFSVPSGHGLCTSRQRCERACCCGREASASHYKSGENLVAAIKGGSRAKLGKPKKHQRVTWAPSVYDPPPSATTIVRHRQPILNITPKKNGGKNRQQPKGKAARKQAKASKWRRGGGDDSD